MRKRLLSLILVSILTLVSIAGFSGDKKNSKSEFKPKKEMKKVTSEKKEKSKKIQEKKQNA